MKKSKYFFHALKAPFDGLPNRLLMYALGLGNFLDALSKNDVGVDPPALDLRQRIEGVPQTAEQLHPLQELLGRGLVQAGRIFNPVLTIQRILRLVPGEPPLVGHLIPGIGQKDSRHLVGNLDKLILCVPIIKIFQIDCSHNKPPFRCLGERVTETGLAGSGTRGSRPAPRDTLSRSAKKRLGDIRPHRRTKLYIHLCTGIFHIHSRTDPI